MQSPRLPLLLRRLAPALAAVLLCLAPVAAAQARHARHAPRRHHGHVASGVCPGADLPAGGASLRSLKAALVCLVNQERVSRGLPPLHESSRLDRSAQGWSNTMVRTGHFWHGSNFAARISAVGYVWGEAGENIATGFLTPRQVMVGWMASPEHCQNILRPGFADIGVGVNARRLGPYGPATWTQDFGRWLGHGAPSGNQRPMQGCPYGA